MHSIFGVKKIHKVRLIYCDKQKQSEIHKVNQVEKSHFSRRWSSFAGPNLNYVLSICDMN